MKNVFLIAALATSAFGLSACQFAAGGTERSERAEVNETRERAAPTRNSAGEAGKDEEGGESATAGGASRAVAAVTADDATNQNFNLNNRSQDTVTHVYVSRVSDEQWGEDVLGSSQVVAPGGTAQITFPRTESECNWDVRVTVNNNQNQELRNINLCTTSEVIYQ